MGDDTPKDKGAHGFTLMALSGMKVPKDPLSWTLPGTKVPMDPPLWMALPRTKVPQSWATTLPWMKVPMDLPSWATTLPRTKRSTLVDGTSENKGAHRSNLKGNNTSRNKGATPEDGQGSRGKVRKLNGPLIDNMSTFFKLKYPTRQCKIDCELHITLLHNVGLFSLVIRSCEFNMTTFQ